MCCGRESTAAHLTLSMAGCQVGIMHTNYLDYARREEGGETKAKLLEAYNNWVCRVHCHKVPCMWHSRAAQLIVTPSPAVAQGCRCVCLGGDSASVPCTT
jgi:hypothetical protein